MNVDLTGAVLIDFDLSSAQIADLACRNARFHGETRLRGARSLGAAAFAGASFTGRLDCVDVDFEHTADFTKACLSGQASFDGCTFRPDATFAAAMFFRVAGFTGTVFLAGPAFSHPAYGAACFQGFVDFRDACFTAARFEHVHFPAGVDFSGAEFGRSAVSEDVHPAVRAATAGRRHPTTPLLSQR